MFQMQMIAVKQINKTGVYGLPIRCTAGGRVTWRRAEELGQVVTETGETSVQTDFEDSGEVWTEVRHKKQKFTFHRSTNTILLKHTYRQVCHLPIQHVSSLVKQLYGHNVILCEPACLQEQKKRDL